MITKVKRIVNVGKFRDYNSKGDGLDWQKNTFLFAPNAYGKSTLVTVPQSLCANDPKMIRARKTLDSAASPEAVVIIDGANHVFKGSKWDKTRPAIQVFDMPFIHANILSHEIEHTHKKNIHRIIIGAQGIKLADEFAKLKDSEKKKRQDVDVLVSQFNRGSFIHHTLDSFLAIPAAEETAIVIRIQKLEQDIKSKESETIVRGLGFPRTLPLLSFDLSAIKALAFHKLAATHKEAEKRVLDHINRNIKDKGRAKDFIRRGLDLVQANCPFCGQDLKTAADLLKAYKGFFDESFRTYQADLKDKAETFSKRNLENDLTTLVSTHNANTTTLKQWEPFIGTAPLPDVVAFVEAARPRLTASRTAIQAELEKRQKDPNADVDLSQFDTMDSELASLRDYPITDGLFEVESVSSGGWFMLE